MKKTLGIVAASALAIAAFGAPAAAYNDNACFGQVHKVVNTMGFAGYETVGQLVQDSEGKGQGKNATAKVVAATVLCVR